MFELTFNAEASAIELAPDLRPSDLAVPLVFAPVLLRKSLTCCFVVIALLLYASITALLTS